MSFNSGVFEFSPLKPSAKSPAKLVAAVAPPPIPFLAVLDKSIAAPTPAIAKELTALAILPLPFASDCEIL